MNRAAAPSDYRIRVRGHLGGTLLGAFPELHAQRDGGETVLQGALRDQAALHGVLARIEALSLELLDVRRVPPSRASGRGSSGPDDDGSADRR